MPFPQWELNRLVGGKWSVRLRGEEQWILNLPPQPREAAEEIEWMLNALELDLPTRREVQPDPANPAAQPPGPGPGLED